MLVSCARLIRVHRSFILATLCVGQVYAHYKFMILKESYLVRFVPLRKIVFSTRRRLANTFSNIQLEVFLKYLYWKGIYCTGVELNIQLHIDECKLFFSFWQKSITLNMPASRYLSNRSNYSVANVVFPNKLSLLYCVPLNLYQPTVALPPSERQLP